MDWLKWILWLLSLVQAASSNQARAASVYQAQQPTPTYYRTGKATFYHAGLMEHVAVIRGVDLGYASGFSTYPDCSRIGGYLEVSVQNPHSGDWSPWSPKRIVDCSQPKDYARHVAEGLVELGYDDAVRYGYASSGFTRIRFYLEGDK
ncbi:MAG TPA: hypothetical protein VIY48_10010 [Candidatus Paceibacterota bacterium]